jgi:DNA-binding CsgD family transcriptional regulator
MSVAEFIEKSDHAGSPEELFSFLVDAASIEGFAFVAYGVLTYREPKQLVHMLPPFIALNYPTFWQHRYAAQKYCEIDPIVVHTPHIGGPYLWRWLPNWFSLDAVQQRIMKEASAAGLKNGVSVPLHGPWGRVAVVSFASNYEDVNPQARLGHLAALATQFHASFANRSVKGDGEPIRLSKREKDCLRWTAEGKSSWDISAILLISENTVNFHLKKAMRKLGTSSRTVAVIKALGLGLIGMPKF